MGWLGWLVETLYPAQLNRRPLDRLGSRSGDGGPQCQGSCRLGGASLSAEARGKQWEKGSDCLGGFCAVGWGGGSNPAGVPMAGQGPALLARLHIGVHAESPPFGSRVWLRGAPPWARRRRRRSPCLGRKVAVRASRPSGYLTSGCSWRGRLAGLRPSLCALSVWARRGRASWTGGWDGLAWVARGNAVPRAAEPRAVR